MISENTRNSYVLHFLMSFVPFVLLPQLGSYQVIFPPPPPFSSDDEESNQAFLRKSQHLNGDLEENEGLQSERMGG